METQKENALHNKEDKNPIPLPQNVTVISNREKQRIEVAKQIKAINDALVGKTSVDEEELIDNFISTIGSSSDVSYLLACQKELINATLATENPQEKRMWRGITYLVNQQIMNPQDKNNFTSTSSKGVGLS